MALSRAQKAAMACALTMGHALYSLATELLSNSAHLA